MLVPKLARFGMHATLCALFAFSLVFFPNVLVAQSRLVISDDAWVRIDDGAWVVITNPATNAITTSGTNGGNIRSEGEFNRVRWQIRDAAAGTYTVPFTSVNGVKIPFTYTVTAPGSNEATASIVFSTYNHQVTGVGAGDEWDNEQYMPLEVTHMNSFNPPVVLNSQHAVDRFWRVDPSAAGYAYGSKPSVRLGFTYENGVATDVTLGNAINPITPLGAQRFNDDFGVNTWGDYLPPDPNPDWSGGPIGSVVNVAVPAADFYRWWTLANITEPLPVRLLDFAAKCDGSSVNLRWSTGAERNSDHFRVERSLDGAIFTPIGRLESAGDSHVTTEYVFHDKAPKSVAYYRLMQVDRDGTEANLGVLVSGCDEQGITEIVNAWDDGYNLNVVVRTHSDQHHNMRLMDAGGKVMYVAPVALYAGLTTIQVPKDGMAQGVYIVRFDGPGMPMSRRVTLLF